MEGLVAITIVAVCVWATNARKTSCQQSKALWDGGKGKFAVRLAVRLDSPLRVKWKPPIAQSRAWHYSNALL